MIVYCVMIATSVFFGWVATNLKRGYEKNPTSKNRINYKIFAFLSFLPTFLVSAFRTIDVGTDTSGTYLEIYYKSLYGGGIRDIGYALINKLCIMIFGNYNSVLVVTSLIISGLAYYSIYKESKNPKLSIFLFFATNVFFISMNMIRQSIATSIFIFAIPYIKNKSLFKYMLCIAIATTIHSASIIYLPAYFIFNMKFDRKKIAIIILIISVFKSLISSTLIKLLLLNDYFKTYFAWYLSSKYNEKSVSIVSLTIAALILIYLLMIYHKAKDDKDYKILVWSQTIATCMLILSGQIPLMQRTSWLFSFLLFVYLPNTFQYIENRNKRLFWKCSISSGYLMYMIVTTFIMGYNEVIPYSSILF